MMYFTADSHFTLTDYEDVVLRDFRPFKTTKQMNNTIIKKWNKQAKKGDTIYHLGDFANFSKNEKHSYMQMFKLVKKINAKVILILGNNEEYIIKHEFGGDYEAFKDYLLKVGFSDVIREGMYLEIENRKFYLNHYPKNHKSDAINLFGHIHGTGFVKRYGFNVGVDNHYLNLFSEKEIMKMVHSIQYYDENVYE